MAKSIVRGNPITLDVFITDGAGQAADSPDLAASIIDPNGTTVVNLDEPTNHPSLGHYQYVYTPAVDAALGAWAIAWSGTINGAPSTDEDGFTVLAAGAMSFPSTGDQVCQPWATHEDASGMLATYSIDPDELDLAMAIASDILWNLTRRKWPGVCTDSVRPQAQWKKWDGPPMWWPSVIAEGIGGSPWGFCSCHRGRETGCSRIPEIRLPRGPVDPASVSVMLNGEPFTEFRVDDSRWLVRTDGSQWPCCQDLLLPDTENNTYSVSYNFGNRPPRAGVRMCALYGCQLALAMNPALSGKCILPERVTRVSRQGTTTSFADASTLIEKGQVGLTAVDSWVASVNAGQASRRATVMVPGRWRPVRRVNH